MKNTPRLASQLAQNGSFCANYKRKYCGFKTNSLASHTHSPHKMDRGIALFVRSLFVHCPPVLSLSLLPWVSPHLASHASHYSLLRFSLFLSLVVGLSSAVALSLAVGLSHPASRASRCSLLRLSLVVGLSHASRWVSLSLSAPSIVVARRNQFVEVIGLINAQIWL